MPSERHYYKINTFMHFAYNNDILHYYIARSLQNVFFLNDILRYQSLTKDIPSFKNSCLYLTI